MSLGVGEDLNLDVARMVQVALDVDGWIAEVALCFAGSTTIGVLDLALLPGNAKTAATPTGRGFEGDRIAVRGGKGLSAGDVDRARTPRHDRNAGPLGDRPGLDLVTHGRD